MKNKSIKAVLVSLLVSVMLISCAAPALSQAPPFTLKDNTGRQISLSDYTGKKAVLLIFFNFMTGTGQDPLLQGYLTRYRAADKLETICIVDSSFLPDPAKQYMAEHAVQNQGGLGYAVPLRDENGNVSLAYTAKADALTLVLVDTNGFIRFRQDAPPDADTNTELAKQIRQATK